MNFNEIVMKRFYSFLFVLLSATIAIFSQQTNIVFIGNSISQGVLQDNPPKKAPAFTEYALPTVDVTPTTDPQKGMDAPSLRVFLPNPDGATGRMVIVLPGGGYQGLALFHEGYDWAPYFLSKGIAVGVLKYRMSHGDRTLPYADVKAAFDFVKQHAVAWHIDPAQIGIMGASAGGHLASTYATHTKGADLPAFQILMYPVITMEASFTYAGSRKNLLGDEPTQEVVELYSNEKQVSDDTPRTFMIFAADDSGVPPLNGLRYAEALCRHKVPVTFVLYSTGEHGFGCRDSFPYKRQFLDELSAWLQSF